MNKRFRVIVFALAAIGGGLIAFSPPLGMGFRKLGLILALVAFALPLGWYFRAHRT